MNKKAEHPDSIYTQQVKRLVNLVYPSDLGYGSALEDALAYFGRGREINAEYLALSRRLNEEQNLTPVLREKLSQQASLLLKDIESQKLERRERLESIIDHFLALTEGDTLSETQMLSAKFLGTLSLISYGEQRIRARVHQRLKPLYKACLVLRLVDKLLSDEAINHSYLKSFAEASSRFSGNRFWRERWRNELAAPLVMAALLQDIGLHGQSARCILLGEEGNADEFRLLNEDERKQLLKVNYRDTLDYVVNALGSLGYKGNSKEERDQFVATQSRISEFLIALVRDAFVTSTSGLGELLKIPQIYASVVLSTKLDFKTKDLPKGYLLIEQMGNKGAFNKKITETFLSIVGLFPQGFGVTYIPRNEKGVDREQYECAIVTQLNPSHPSEPICRPVTRNLTFISSGTDETVKATSNLYYATTKKRLMRLGKERLVEIMSLLSSDYDPNNAEELIPSCWDPRDYFSYKKHQNLWNRNT